MSFAQVILLLVLAPLLAASAFCSAAETSLLSLTHGDRVRLRKVSPSAATAAEAMLAHPRALLVSVLLLNNIVNVAYFVVSSVLAASLGREQAWAGVALGAVSVLGLILTAEILPKLLAARLRVATARLVARPLWAWDGMVRPIRAFIDRRVVAPLVRLLRPEEAEERTATVEELSQLLTVSAGEGDIEAEDHRLLQDVVGLSTLRVREVMTHRVDMEWLDVVASDAEVMETIRRTGANALLVCAGSPDRGVLGWLDVKRHLAKRQETGRPPALSDSLQPTLYVPERARLDQLLDLLRQARRFSAVAVDEYGSVVGMVGIEDVLRRLVVDPVPVAGGGVAGVERLGDGQWRVSGRTSVRDLAEFFERPGGGRTLDRTVSTVAGLILLRLGRVPRVGDTVRLGNVELRVESMDGRIIERVLVSLSQARPGAAA